MRPRPGPRGVTQRAKTGRVRPSRRAYATSRIGAVAPPGRAPPRRRRWPREDLADHRGLGVAQAAAMTRTSPGPAQLERMQDRAEVRRLGERGHRAAARTGAAAGPADRSGRMAGSIWPMARCRGRPRSATGTARQRLDLGRGQERAPGTVMDGHGHVGTSLCRGQPIGFAARIEDLTRQLIRNTSN